jgi:hypothetical protein
MTPSIHQTQEERAVPVRWFECSWTVAVEAQATPTIKVSCALAPGATQRFRAARPRKMPVTTPKSFSQPRRASRHRR